MPDLNEKLCVELANVPIARPGFDALTAASSCLTQINPQGQWETAKPGSLDENRLRAAVQHLLSSDVLPTAQSYCSQCAAEAKRDCGGRSNYIPIIMMPVYPASECAFDIDGQIQQMESDEAKHKKPTKATRKQTDSDADADKDKKKPKKRGWTMQRLTDFDLLSQW